MKTVYLDYNVIVSLIDNTNLPLKKLVNSLGGTFNFPYSPAHMEEIATPNMIGVNDKVRVKNKLRYIEKLSKKYEFFPTHIGPTIIKREKPRDCYDRVVNHYAANKVIEKNENEMLKEFKERDVNGKISSSISNMKEDILSTPEYDVELKKNIASDILLTSLYEEYPLEKEVMNNIKFSLLTMDHVVKERVLEITFNFLEYIRYKPENIKKSRSRMHDCTHAIYGSSADIFVSDDARFLSKVLAVYNYFNIDTEVLNVKEFIEKYSTELV